MSVFFGGGGESPYDGSRVGSMLPDEPDHGTVLRLLGDVSAGIRVLRARDGITLSDDQIQERARNIVMAIVGNYRIESIGDEDSGALTPSEMFAD
jgi:hypothetical protein